MRKGAHRGGDMARLPHGAATRRVLGSDARGCRTRNLLFFRVVSAYQVRWPDELVVRLDHFSSRGPKNPRGNKKRDDRIEDETTRQGDEETRCDRGKRYVYITHVVEVRQADRRILRTWLQQQPSDPPI